MRIISIDIGIKNLAYCLFDKPESCDKYEIIDWDIVNLSEESDTKICCEKNKGIPCLSEVKFVKSGKCYCLKHAKKQEYLLPFLKPNSLNKMKLGDLLETAEKYGIVVPPNSKKGSLISLIQQFVEEKCFEPTTTTNASKVDLVTIGRNIKYKFEKLFKEGSQPITHVVIENQISPIANRMKTIQGMVAQYFIMKNSNVCIDFVSSANKLKGIVDKTKTTYSERKKLGIQTCVDSLNSEKWQTFFKNHKKKDDLADSFLQGKWYISTL
jgi:hypothetical protein